MNHLDKRQLRTAISKYTQSSTELALLIFAIDLIIYISAIMGVILLEMFSLRILCSVIAGIIMSSIFVIGHDAAHNSFTRSRILNLVIGRIAFLPSLHNFGLWLTAHNRLHHHLTNLKGVNSWSPLSKKEFDALPAWKQTVERFYRSPLGICFNYMIERWWKNKFYPYKKIIGKYNSVYYDFLLIVAYLVFYLCLLGYVSLELTHTNPIEVLTLGFFLPFIIFNFMVGFTVYQQHTHESIPWFKSKEERETFGKAEKITMHVCFPRWYNLMSHNAMEHPVHHVDPRIPLYYLPEAQKTFASLVGDDLHYVNFSLKGFLQTMAKCKLYDFENHCWLDFNGKLTSRIKLTSEEEYFIDAA